MKERSNLERFIALEGFHDKNELEEVFLDVQDWLAGNPSIYAIDTFDIISYCFPFSLDQNTAKLSYEAAASNFLSYYYFFNHYDYNPVVLDEYEVELYSIFRKISKYSQNYESVSQIEEDLIKEFNASKDNPKDFFNRKLGVLISIIYGLLDNDSLETFKSIVNDKLQIRKLRLGSNLNTAPDKLDEANLFSIIRSTTWDKEQVDKVMDLFTTENSRILASMHEVQRDNYLDSTLIDIQVLVRLYAINKKINEHYEDQSLTRRYKFLYLSSTPSKSDKIQNSYSSIHKDGHNTFLLRKNYQFYLMALLKELLNDSNQKSSEVLKDIVRSDFLNCIEKFNEIKTFLSENPSMSDKIENDIGYGRKELENSFLNIKIFKDIEDLSNKIRNREKNDLQNILDDLIVRVRKSKYDDLVSTMKSNLETYLQTYDVYTQIYQKPKLKVTIPIGNDIVKSKFQSLPILIFQMTRAPKEVKDRFANDLLRLINSDPHENGLNFHYYDLKREFALSSVENKFLLCFLSFLSVNAIPGQTESGLIPKIEKLLIHNKYRNYTWNFTDENRLDVNVRARLSTQIELIYFLSWLKRRTNKVNEFKSALKEIETFENQNRDIFAPQLVHSKALLYVSWAFVETNETRKIDYYNSGILLCKAAMEQFDSDKAKSIFNGASLEYAIIGLKNTIVYCLCQIALSKEDYTEIFDRDRDDDYQPRKLLRSLKESELLAYNQYFALNHTEIDLEFCELQYYKRIGDLEMVRHILKYAKQRLKSISRMEGSEKKMHEDFRESVRRIRNFRLK